MQKKQKKTFRNCPGEIRKKNFFHKKRFNIVSYLQIVKLVTRVSKQTFSW